MIPLLFGPFKALSDQTLLVVQTRHPGPGGHLNTLYFGRAGPGPKPGVESAAFFWVNMPSPASHSWGSKCLTLVSSAACQPHVALTP
jgi:hypothetical protein